MKRIILAIAAATTLVLASMGAGAQQCGDCSSYALYGDLAAYAECRRDCLVLAREAMEVHLSCMGDCAGTDEPRSCLQICANANPSPVLPPEDLYLNRARVSPIPGQPEDVVEWDIYQLLHTETLDCSDGYPEQCSSCLLRCYPALGSNCIQICCPNCTPPERE